MKFISIIEEPNVFSDHILDVMGSDFNFSHEKGVAEWVKNSADAYIREGVPDSEQNVILRFTDSDKSGALLECIDFVGMSSNDIQEAFKRWGDPDAAKRGHSRIKVYGGHGNGGKFYMRQMFQESYFITYKNGKLNVYGFNENRKYGFKDGKRDLPFDIDGALKFAEIENLVPAHAKAWLKSGKMGFTVVRGIAPHQMPNKIKAAQICEKLIRHPQARRVLMKIPVAVIHNSETLVGRLTPPEIKPKVGFEDPVKIQIPETIIYIKDGEEKKIKTINNKYLSSGNLVLKTSELAMSGTGRFSDLNRIDITGELGVIGSYKILNLGVKNAVQSAFIYGECHCPIFEDSENCYVRNDRESLVESDLSDAVLYWIAEQVDMLAEKMAQEEKSQQEVIQQKLSSKYNDFLNSWKNKLMTKIYAQILGGSGSGPGGGFGVGGSSGGSSGKDSSGEGGGGGSSSGKNEGGGNQEKKKGRKFPEVKLSGFDLDPLNPTQTIHLDPRQPIIYQRSQDVVDGIYWINTSSPLASAIIEKHGAESARWRDYLFQRYVDIFVKEGLGQLMKREPENFSTGADQVIDDVILWVHTEASKDLGKFLFEDLYEPSTETIL